jgi:hypothetical protein
VIRPIKAASCDELSNPLVNAPGVFSCVYEDGARSMHEQGSQVLVALLGDPPHLDMAPLEYCLGTKPSQAANWRPCLKSVALPTVATTALADHHAN